DSGATHFCLGVAGKRRGAWLLFQPQLQLDPASDALGLSSREVLVEIGIEENELILRLELGRDGHRRGADRLNLRGRDGLLRHGLNRRGLCVEPGLVFLAHGNRLRWEPAAKVSRTERPSTESVAKCENEGVS